MARKNRNAQTASGGFGPFGTGVYLAIDHVFVPDALETTLLQVYLSMAEVQEGYFPLRNTVRVKVDTPGIVVAPDYQDVDVSAGHYIVNFKLDPAGVDQDTQI